MDSNVAPAEIIEGQVAADRANPILYRAYKPPPPLADYVASFWYCDGYHLPHARERLLPGGAMALLISLGDDPVRVFCGPHDADPRCFRGPVIGGAYAGPIVIDTACQASLIGVHFKPGGAVPFLGVPADELRDAHLSLDLLWGAPAGELRDRLRDAGAPAARFRILEQALVARLARPLARHPAVVRALREFHGGPRMRPISAVAAESGLSARRFIQVFSAEVGLTPKVYCRLRRFQRPLRHLYTGQPGTGADIAAAYGYCDQAHLIHDFRAFSGLTPTAYRARQSARRGARPDHVPLHG